MAVLVSIPVTNHQNLLRPISGRFIAARHHGSDIEFVLEGGTGFSITWDDTRDLVRLAGPIRSGLQLTYDGHTVAVSQGV
ncbi:MAG: hypothetical protein L6Q80_08055 [Dehalococcoidia bacterium]|nr:hypothetical protein [Dehalococcoidia bacterium]